MIITAAGKTEFENGDVITAKALATALHRVKDIPVRYRGDGTKLGKVRSIKTLENGDLQYDLDLNDKGNAFIASLVENQGPVSIGSKPMAKEGTPTPLECWKALKRVSEAWKTGTHAPMQMIVDYIELKLLKRFSGETLDREEKRRTALEEMVILMRKRFPIDPSLGKRSSPDLRDVEILASLIWFDVMDGLITVPQEEKK